MKVLLYFKNGWLVIGITILLFVAIELVSYVLVSIRYIGIPIDSRSRADAYEDTTWAENYFKELASLPGFRWHPYVYWRRKPSQGQYFNVDEDGLRRTWKAAGDMPSETRFRIFMMGGSTTWGAGAPDDETIPSIVAQLLTREHGLNVDVTNFGASGYVSTQEVIALFRELQRGNVPDLVIFYDGVNDTFSTFQNRGLAGLPMNESNREREFNLSNPEHIGRLYREVVRVTVRSSSTYQVMQSLVRRITGRDLLSLGGDRSVYPPPNKVADEVVRVYAWNMKLVNNLGQAYGFQTLFFWQPVVFTKDLLTPYEQQVRDEAEGSGRYYTAATIAAKAQLADVASFHDVSDVFRGNSRPYFFDTVHITGAGNEIVARRMLRQVLPIAQKIKAKLPQSVQ